MAEVLGLVASAISVAQFAGSIVTTSLKVKALLDEVKGAPESLRDMLDHIELLTPILCEAVIGDDEGAGTNLAPLPATSHLQKAMQKALKSCQAAGEQLEILATDLMSQIEAARGGVRRKRAVFKVVLKKGTLAQYETRLQRTIQLLTLAQSTYIIALQKSQPETIVSQLLSALVQSPQSAQSPTKIPCDPSLPEIRSPRTATGSRISTNQNTSALQECWQLGFAKVVGLVRIHTSSRGKDDPTNTSTRDRALRVQVQMPTWLCATVLDAVFSRNYFGWNCSLNMYGRLREGCVEFELAFNALYDDDVDAIHRLFQERRCGPRDLLVWDVGNEDSLLSCALMAGAWRTSAYLLNYGASQPDSTHRLLLLRQGSERLDSCIEALLRNDLTDTVRMTCLASCWNDLDSFTALVGRLWPYNEFYTAAFEDQRLDLAMVLVRTLDSAWNSPSPAVFQHLCESSSLAEGGSSITRKILSCITSGLGNIVWYDPDVASRWFSAIQDTALRLGKSLVMPQQQLLGYQTIRSPFVQLFPTSTPFTDVFLGSMLWVPGFNRYPKCARQHKIGSRLANCERSVQMWLDILRDCGIDLLEYGRQEMQRLTEQADGCEFRIYRDLWHEGPPWNTDNGLFVVRLIGFEYGRETKDWKLWWSEPTDGLVGDFWREVEPEPLFIPGSWDEDF